MPDAVTFDLDSTIADTLHRQWMVADPDSADWEAYSAACGGDTPIEGTVQLMNCLSERGYRLWIITGRSASASTATHAWLDRNLIPYTGLLMRSAYDRTKNGEFKVEVLQKLAKAGYNVLLHVDDYPEAARYVTEKTGIPVLLVNADYPADAPHSVKGGV